MALPTPPMYDDVLLGVDLSRGAAGGSMKPARLIRMPSGREQRIKLWAGSKKRWTLPYDMRPLSHADLLVAFWEARDGGQRAFRFHDPAEYQVTDQALVPDGSPYVQLIRSYVSGGQTRTKNIFAPVATITVKKNGGTITPAQVVYTTGVVTLPVILQKAITAISQASSAVVTVGAAHGFAVNDRVFFSGVTGMVEINNLVGTVSATGATTITLGGTSGIDSSNFSAYVSGGSATKYLATTDTLTWTGSYDHVARFDEQQQQMVADDAFIRSWSVPLVEVTQGSGEVELIDPVTLGSVEVYLRSDLLAGTDGSTPSAYPDISGNARDGSATAGLQPILRKTGANISPNGKQMAEFDGTDDQVTGPLPVGGISNANGYTLYFYIKELALTTGGFNCQQLWGSSAFEVMTRTAVVASYPAEQQYGMRGGVFGTRKGYGATTLGYQVVCARFSAPAGSPTSGTMDLFIDGVAQGPGQQNWSGTMDTGYLLSANAGLNCAFRGMWGATVFVSATHTDQQVRGVTAFLKNFFEGT